MGGFGYRGWGGMGGGMATATQTNIPIGTIIVDMVNPKTNEMFWRGTAQDQVSGTGADKGQVQERHGRDLQELPPDPVTLQGFGFPKAAALRPPFSRPDGHCPERHLK